MSIMLAVGTSSKSVNSSLKFRAGMNVARRLAGRTRTGRVTSAALVGARATLRSVTHALHVFFLQTTALFFSVFAVIGGAAAVREYSKYTAGQATIGKVAVGAVFS